MGMTVGGGEGSDTGDVLARLRPWLRLFLGISGGAVAIACTLGLLVVLTTAMAQAQAMLAHEGSGGIREEEQDRIGQDPSWQPPSMHQGIFPAQGSSEVAADAAGFVEAALESDVAGEIESEPARDIDAATSSK